MSNNKLSEADSNNKENEDQGNKEKIENKQEEEDVDDVLNNSEFLVKYEKLQKQWLQGHRKEGDLDKDMVKKYGEHSYILQYILDNKNNKNNKTDIDKMVFHPKYSYIYSKYEKDNILKLMNESQLAETQKNYESHILRLESKIFDGLHFEEQKEKKDTDDDKRDIGGWVVPEYSIPIRADIRKFNFSKLAQEQRKLSGRLFDAIMMDPPWQLATANPTRGVAIGYSQLEDNIISSIPINILQDNGLLFVWVINAKYRLALQLFKKWGYTMIGDIGWVKQTVNRRIANGHGFYLQHAKETCLIGLKGDFNKINSYLNLNKSIKGICSDIIYSERRGQSQKPEEVYQYIEQLIPNGFYMEIFGRRNNLRNGWLTIGNEL